MRSLLILIGSCFLSATAVMAQDFAKVSPGNVKVELDTDAVRVLRVKVSPREKLAMHQHLLPYVVIYLSDIHLMHYLPNGKSEEVRGKAGDVRWVGPVKHSDENLSDAPFECMLVEIKPNLSKAKYSPATISFLLRSAPPIPAAAHK